MLIRQMCVAVMAFAAVLAFSVQVEAGERDLLAKSSGLIAAEIDGLGAPDAKFLIASLGIGGKGSVEQMSKDSSVGDQGGTQVVQRSSGCSTGCTTGCSTGCTTGCSVGCTVGCSVGCSVGCR